jgi:hypothetical protein
MQTFLGKKHNDSRELVPRELQIQTSHMNMSMSKLETTGRVIFRILLLFLSVQN